VWEPRERPGRSTTAALQERWGEPAAGRELGRLRRRLLANLGLGDVTFGGGGHPPRPSPMVEINRTLTATQR